MVAFFVDMILMFGLWLLISWSLHWQELIAGVVVAAIGATITSKLFPVKQVKLFHSPIRFFWFLLYIPYFLYYLVIANLDVAYRVLHPELPIKPGIVRFKTNLKSPLAKTVLANSITLTPGTMTVDVVDQDMYIHWIYVRGEKEEEWYREVAGRFEGMIRRIFE